MSTNQYLKNILQARVYEVAEVTPLEIAPKLSARLGVPLFLKREDQQKNFSFKLRGAFNKIAHLTPAQLKKGVVAASAGNHAQGVAMAAARFNCRAHIYMPAITPQIKIDAVRALGGKVYLHGDSYDAAYEAALTDAHKFGRAVVHPYDDPLVIAGQGTIAVEILRQHNGPLHAVFCPVGGGGLIAGVALYIKSLRPEIKIIGVETHDADAMRQSLKLGHRLTLAHVGQFADGTAVKTVGQETFRLCREHVDQIVCVSTDELCAAIKDAYEDTRSILEPSGALSIAGAKQYAARRKVREPLVAITTGANVNFDRLRFVAERAEVGEEREAVLAVTINEKPGSFLAFCTQLGKRSITEFNYRYADVKVAHVFVGLQVQSRQERKSLVHSLKRHHLPTLDLTDDEMSKLHLRHLVGGRAMALKNERLFRFEFPERPGALLNFLSAMSGRWNISLFHYRNHGADYGRVLVGMQVPRRDYQVFQNFLKNLGYRYQEETTNPAYRLFLA